MKRFGTLLQPWMFCTVVAATSVVGGVTKAGTHVVLKSFTVGDGDDPECKLVLSGHTLYGTTIHGGSSDDGTVFKLNTDGTGFTVLKNFNGTEGARPGAGLVLSGQSLYGTTRDGGLWGAGTVFRINTDGAAFTVLKDFTRGDGTSPGGLVLSEGTLYGTTLLGGSSNHGTVFKVNTDGTGFASLKEFDGSDEFTVAGLVSSGAVLYGTTYGSRINLPARGTVFRLNTDGSDYKVLKYFIGPGYYHPPETNSDGLSPYAGVALSNSTLYGSTQVGGLSGQGALFRVNTDGTGFTVFKSFKGSDGATPSATLLVSDSTLYGTTAQGGNSRYGTVFQINTDGTGYRLLKNFNRGDGAYPFAELVLSGTTLYGTTSSGGTSDYGTVFKLYVNDAPIAVASVSPLFSILPGETNLFVLSPNGVNASVVLDGSQSSDAGNGPLQFSWYVDAGTNALAGGALSTNLFLVGGHALRLVVTDDRDSATAEIRLEVISPAGAVGQLMRLVDEADLGTRNKKPLFASLSAAISSFDRGDTIAAFNHLLAFQFKIDAQIAPWNPALAAKFIAALEKIFSGVGEPLGRRSL